MAETNPPAEARAPTPPPAIEQLAGTETVGSYFTNWITRLSAGDTGALPVIAGLILLAIIFQSLNGNFLTAGNLVNLMVQGSVYMLFSLGMIFILLLGEIDLS